MDAATAASSGWEVRPRPHRVPDAHARDGGLWRDRCAVAEPDRVTACRRPSAVAPADTDTPAQPDRDRDPEPSGDRRAGPLGLAQVPSQTTVTGVNFTDVIWTGTRFVAVASRPDDAQVILDSTDGVTWHRQPESNAKGYGTLTLVSGGIVAPGTAMSWFSADGLTWTSRRSSAFPMPAVGSDTVEVTDVVAGSDGWIAVGRRDHPCQIDCGDDPVRAYVWTSSDGSGWSRVPDQPALKGGGMDAVARTDHGYVAVGVAFGHAAIWTSADGRAWSRVPDAPMFREPASRNGALPLHATGVAVRDGGIVVVGSAYAQDTCAPGVALQFCPGVRAWWSVDGKTWAKASVDKAKDGQAGRPVATIHGFFLGGWSTGCIGGIWTSTNGHAWRCEASAKGFKGFTPEAFAASDTVEVAVGSVEVDPDAEPSVPRLGAIWYRTR